MYMIVHLQVHVCTCTYTCTCNANTWKLVYVLDRKIGNQQNIELSHCFLLGNSSSQF